MFVPRITPEGVAQEIACRMLGTWAVSLNDILKAFESFPAMYRIMNVLLNPAPGQFISSQDLNTAMTELLSELNRKTDNNLNLNPMQKAILKSTNQVFVSMVYGSIISDLRIVAIHP